MVKRKIKSRCGRYLGFSSVHYFFSTTLYIYNFYDKMLIEKEDMEVISGTHQVFSSQPFRQRMSLLFLLSLNFDVDK